MAREDGLAERCSHDLSGCFGPIRWPSCCGRVINPRQGCDVSQAPRTTRAHRSLGEPLCANGHVDNFNGGCNSDPDVSGHIECGQTVAGTYGTFLSRQGANFRDTDWYEFTLPQAANVTWTAVGEARTRVFIMRAPCPAASLGTGVADACQPATATVANLAAGTYAFVGTDVFTGVACGSRFRATLTVNRLRATSSSLVRRWIFG